MIIRHALEKDIPAIVRLSNRFPQEVPTWGLVTRSEDEFEQLDHNLIWVVEDNSRLTGYAICFPKENKGENIFNEDDKILELDEIYIVPESRGKGVGSELLGTIMDDAKKAGYTKFFVYSSVKDLMPVIRFYRDNGLKTWAVQCYRDLK